MKLDRCRSVPAVLVAMAMAAMAATGCGTRASTKPIAASPPTVSTTRLMAAELDPTDDAPKVGKSHRSGSTAEEADAEKKDAPHRTDRRPGGGFSGYK